VVVVGEAGDEEGDGAVADELVDDAVPLVDHPGRSAVEARDQERVLVGRHALGHGGRAAHIRKEQGELDLRTAGLLASTEGRSKISRPRDTH
jgi:hypothetical protein